jgi:hypothetical protein
MGCLAHRQLARSDLEDERGDGLEDLPLAEETILRWPADFSEHPTNLL